MLQNVPRILWVSSTYINKLFVVLGLVFTELVMYLVKFLCSSSLNSILKFLEQKLTFNKPFEDCIREQFEKHLNDSLELCDENNFNLW